MPEQTASHDTLLIILALIILARTYPEILSVPRFFDTPLSVNCLTLASDRTQTEGARLDLHSTIGTHGRT